jgi:SAM-dependent methyltransferase
MGTGRYSDMKFTVNRCGICGLGFTEPIPTESTAHLLYETRESNDFQPNDSPLVARLKGIATRSDVRGFVKGLDLPEGPVLDFGCGNAAFTTAMRDVFPTREAFGADLQNASPSALSTSNYLTYSALFAGSRRYAFIICRHVLEHSYDPVGLLSSLYDLLAPGGFLVLEVPSIETAVAKLFGKSWAGFYVPYHPIHFSSGSLRAAVEAAGFKAIREGGAEMPHMGRSIRNMAGCRYHLGLFIVGVLLHPMQVAVGIATNTSVCLRIWCQKPTESAFLPEL